MIMKTFTTVCAQGDVYIRRIDKLPNGLVPHNPEKGRVIVAHSETGHHHTMLAEHVTAYRSPDSLMDLFLKVKAPTALEHHREFDTHEPILFDTGYFHVRRQREYTPEGWRRVED
jgi:hypothetical protein